jgi:RimJ/RimL family protein N-acetyltransferase
VEAVVELLTYSERDRMLTLALESDPAVVGHLGGVVDADAAAQVHERRIAAVADGDLFFTIVSDGGRDPVGIIAIWRSQWESRQVHELGAMLLPRYQAQGIAGRAFDLLLPRALEAGVGELHSFPAVANGPSNAILSKLGFRRLAECDLDYEGRPLRCVHWLRDLRADAPSAVP